jgi:muramoyltetrapeptide carboxypeptidase
LKRRNFIKTISAASVAASMSPHTILNGKNVQGQNLIKPKRLEKGDTIALVTPGSYITQTEKEESINNIRSLGFNITYSGRLMEKNGYFSAEDKERAADLNEMFEREDVDGIMCARGGYGCARILPFLDYNLIHNNPKPFIGFSDVTAVHFALYKKSNLVSFHGPVSISTFSRFSTKNFEDVLVNPTFELRMRNSNSNNNYNPYGITTITKGIATGELVGGNLSIVSSLIGTEYDVDFSGKMIYLEEFLEEPYRIDRMLTQLLQAGKFDNASGVALGVFKLCEPKKSNPAFKGSFNLMEVLKDKLGNLNIPVVYGLSFGHVIDKLTLPFGIKAELNTEKQELKLLEQAII